MTSISPNNINISFVETSTAVSTSNHSNIIPDLTHVRIPSPKYHHLVIAASTSPRDRSQKTFQPSQAIVLNWDPKRNKYVNEISTPQSPINPPFHQQNPSPTFYRSSSSAFRPFKQGTLE